MDQDSSQVVEAFELPLYRESSSNTTIDTGGAILPCYSRPPPYKSSPYATDWPGQTSSTYSSPVKSSVIETPSRAKGLWDKIRATLSESACRIGALCRPTGNVCCGVPLEFWGFLFSVLLVIVYISLIVWAFVMSG